jgi:hypothetical protein
MFALGVVNVAWRWVFPALGWLLLPVGQHSLSAYLLHVPVVMVVTRLGVELFGGGEHSSAENVALQIVGTLGVWALIEIRPDWRQLWRAIRRASTAAWLDTCSPTRRAADMQLPEPSSRSV